MSNPFIIATVPGTAHVVYDDGKTPPTVIPAGGPIQWSCTPPNAVSLGTQDDAAQSVHMTGALAWPNAVLTAKEPTSGFTASVTFDVKAIQALIANGSVVITFP